MKKLLSGLLAVVLCFTMGIFAACNNPEEPAGPQDTLNLKTINWKGNEEAGEMTYSITKVTKAEDPLVIDYQKNGEWQYCSAVIGFEESDLKLMKTLVIKGKMTSDAKDYSVTLKFTGKDDFGEKEVSFTMSETEKTYEWDLSAYEMDKVITLLLFAEGNVKVSTGKITFSELYLTKEAVNPANKIETAPEPTGEDINEISATQPKMNNNWVDNGDGAYTITKEGTGFKVDYNKKSEWSAMKAMVKGDWSTYKSIKLTVKGTKDDKIMLKPFDKQECQVEATLTGNEDVVIADITGVTVTGEQPVLIFAQPGEKDKTGTFTIINAEFSAEEAPKPEPVVPGDGAEKTIAVSGWVSNDEGVYTPEAQQDGSVKVTYAKETGREWAFLKAPVTSDIAKEAISVTFRVQGAAGKEIMFKPFNKFETTKTFDGEVQEFTVELTEAFDASQGIIIFVEPNKAGDDITGEFTIINCVLTYKQKVSTVTADNLDITDSQWWYEHDPNTYTCSKTDEGVQVTCTETGSWRCAVLYFNLDGINIEDLKTVKVTIKATAGLQIFFKPFDRTENETKIVPANGELACEIDLSAVADKNAENGTYKIVLIVSPESAVENGTVTITNLEFTKA